MYKSLGPISFHSESESAEIFVTEQHWLIQPRALSVGTGGRLQEIALKYNKSLGKELCRVYGEPAKVASLMMDRTVVRAYSFGENTGIDLLCTLCDILVSSFQIAGTRLKGCPKIEDTMFFQISATGEGFYLHLHPQDPQQNPSLPELNACQRIIQYIDGNIAINLHVSNKLLLTKLRKCENLRQMRDELDYFRKVYEIGVRKVQKQIKSKGQQQFTAGESTLAQKLSHRKYRKRSDEFHQDKYHAWSGLASNCKKSSSSEHQWQQGSKKSILIQNFYKHSLSSVHASQKGAKIALFSNRNKSAKGLHSNATFHHASTARLQVMGSFSLTKNGKKGMIQKSKNQNKKLTSYAYSSCFNKTCKNYDAKVNGTNTSSVNYSSLGKMAQSCKNTFYNDHVQPNQAIATGNTKQKEIKKEGWDYRNFVFEEKETDKHNEAKLNDIQKQAGAAKNSMTHNKNSLSKNSRNSQEGSSAYILIDTEKRSIKMAKDCEQIDENVMEQLQQINLATVAQNKDNEQTIRNSKKKMEIEPVIYRKSQLSSIPSDKLSQKSDLLSSNGGHTSVKRTDQLNTQHDKQKEKTARKKNAPVAEILENNLLKNTKAQLDRIDYIGECVTRMPSYMSSLNNGQKYLWQLPAFILYKEFYTRRLEIEEKLKQQIAIFKNPKQQLTSLLGELAQQNKQTKQSLMKLLKVTLKKMKKYEIDPRTVQESKNFLNLDLSIKWSQRADEIIYNFIVELEEIREAKGAILGLIVEVCDAYLICTQGPFDVAARKAINVDNYQDQNVKDYFRSRITAVEG